MNPTFWSEYKTTFCEPTKCILNYIISKGYIHDTFYSRYFQYNHFNNHFSSDMNKTHIGIKKISTECHKIMYIPEINFNSINNDLEQISQSDIDIALSSNKETFIIKRGILLLRRSWNGNVFNNLSIIISNDTGTISHNNFTHCKNHNGYAFCKLELVNVKNNDNEGFVPVIEQAIELKKDVDKFDELSVIIDNLKIEHNNQFLEISNLCEVRILSLIDKIKQLEDKLEYKNLNNID